MNVKFGKILSIDYLDIGQNVTNRETFKLRDFDL